MLMNPKKHKPSLSFLVLFTGYGVTDLFDQLIFLKIVLKVTFWLLWRTLFLCRHMWKIKACTTTFLSVVGACGLLFRVHKRAVMTGYKCLFRYKPKVFNVCRFDKIFGFYFLKPYWIIQSCVYKVIRSPMIALHKFLSALKQCR